MFSRQRTVTILSAAGLAALCSSVSLPSEARASDRYGGVWHEGTATGLFVPLEAGMSFAALQQYRSNWDDLRITDFEIHEQGCPAEEVDLTASQWEEGSFVDELLVYANLNDFENGLVAKCDEGMVLHDFERWNPYCEEEGEQYIALFRESGCDVEFPPYVEISDVWELGDVIIDANGMGYEAVDFELADLDPSARFPVTSPEAMAVFYGGSNAQHFETFDRPDFESTMLDHDGQYVLEDMESYRAEETRYVSALWNLEESRDEHEVGEVYGMFGRLLYMEQSTRKLEDFEVYPNAYDRRFEDTFAQELGFPQAHGFAVMQGGDVVAKGGDGLAIRPVDSSNLGVAMTANTVGVSASVTKFVTALGVVKYAQLHPGPGDWLDTYMVDVLPSDFGDFGPGVDQITIRDLITQQTGLQTFVPEPGSDFINNVAGWRKQMIDWLTLPVETTTSPKPRKYQNIHFELLALIMDEVELPPIVPGTDPWKQWLNDEVFAPAGIGWRDCFPNPGDARDYPYEWSATSTGVYFTEPNWLCAGGGTGIAMAWISPMDMAKLADGIRNATIVDSDRADEILAWGMGLDEADGVTVYQPDNDNVGSTIGEAIHSKNGGLGTTNAQGDIVGMETVTVMYDDLDHDDDGNGDYRYEIGHTELSVALTVHSSPIDTDDPCPNGMCTRLYPVPWVMIVDALLLPEDW